MDRQKLNRAAGDAGKDFVLCADTFENFFKQGAYWLMRQPLSERLTDKEKEYIKERYNFYQNQKSQTNKLLYKRIRNEFEYIFGEDLLQ